MSIGDIFPESRGESKNQWEYGWDGLPVIVREEKPSSIVKMFIPCAIDATVVVSSIPSWESRGYKAMTMAYVVIPKRFSFTWVLDRGFLKWGYPSI